MFTSIAPAASKNYPANCNAPSQAVESSINVLGHFRWRLNGQPSEDLGKIEAVDDKVSQDECHRPDNHVDLLE